MPSHQNARNQLHSSKHKENSAVLEHFPHKVKCHQHIRAPIKSGDSKIKNKMHFNGALNLIAPIWFN